MVHTIRTLIGAFLIAHGLVHAAIWPTPTDDNVPFTVDRSWLFGDVRRAAAAMGIAATVAFVMAGVGYLAQQDRLAIAGLAGGASPLC